MTQNLERSQLTDTERARLASVRAAIKQQLVNIRFRSQGVALSPDGVHPVGIDGNPLGVSSRGGFLFIAPMGGIYNPPAGQK